MPVGHLWYIKRGGQQRGPYPSAVIERNIGLGRIIATDLLSTDGEQWLAATEFPDFELHLQSKGTGAARKLDTGILENLLDGNGQIEMLLGQRLILQCNRPCHVSFAGNQALALQRLQMAHQRLVGSRQ